MANTTFGTNDTETQKLWSAMLFVESLEDIYLKRFMGTAFNSVIMVKNDLKKEKGDRIRMHLRKQMTGAGQSSQTAITLEGNEEAMAFENFDVELTTYGHAVRAGGKLDLQRPVFDLRTEMKNGLKDWLSNKIEDLLVDALFTSPTTNRGLNIGAGQPATGEVLSTALISEAKRKAQLASPKILPIMIKGKKMYLMLAHPYQTKALKVETAWIAAQREAGPRDLSNPIFSGMMGIWDGVVLHEYERCQLFTNTEARALLLGAQAGCVGWAQMPLWYEKLFDYERIPGVAIDFLAGFYKTIFASEDFATVAVDTKYVADSN